MAWVAGIRAAAVAAAFLTGAAATGAATLGEASMPGGAFGSAWNDLTTVGAGYDAISGTGNQNQFDNFRIDLPSGHRTLTFAFAAPAGIGWSYSAGGQILTSAQPVRWGWDGAYARSVQVDYHKPSQSFSLDLGDFQGGALYLALNFTHGSNLAYNVGIPGSALPTAPVTPAPAPVPLPAGVLLLGTGLAAIGGIRLRRRPA